MSAGANCADAVLRLAARLLGGTLPDADNDTRARLLAALLVAAHTLIRGRKPGIAAAPAPAQGTDAGRRRLWLPVLAANLARTPAPAPGGGVAQQIRNALSAERTRLSQALQALLVQAMGGAAHETLPRATAAGFDDIAVTATSMQAAGMVAAHMDQLTSIAGAIERGAESSAAWQQLVVGAGPGALQDPLILVQGVVDALAALAETLGVDVGVALPGARWPANAIVGAAFPEAARGECAMACGAWATCTDAGLPMRHALLHAASALLAHYMGRGDELWLVARCEGPGAAPAGSAPVAATVYLVCHRRAAQPLDGSAEPRAWGPPALADARLLTTALYSGRATLETRWSTADGSPGGRDARGRHVDTLAITERTRGDWLVARLRLAAALEPRPAGPGGATGQSLDGEPSLAEFRAMLHDAHIVLRVPDAAPSGPPEEGGGGTLGAVGQYLSGAGCAVEQVTRRSPGLSRKLVGQRPPAYVIIDNDAELLREEFETLRGTLSFSPASAPCRPAADAQGRSWAQLAGTLGIVVLAPASATVQLRECAQALAEAPHPLPPPVVAVVPGPLSELRLLEGLRAVWERRSPALQCVHADLVPPASANSADSEDPYRDVRTISAEPAAPNAPTAVVAHATDMASAATTAPAAAAVPVSPLISLPSPPIEVDATLLQTLQSATGAGGLTGLASPVEAGSGSTVVVTSPPGHEPVGSGAGAPHVPASDQPEASAESGLSRTRARIRDKMAQLSRVRHRARNRLLGISEGSEAASAAEGSEPCNAAEGAERGASLESALRTSLGEAGTQLTTRVRSNTAGPPAAPSHREREMDVDKALPDPPVAPESAASAQAPQEKDAAHPPRKAAGAADRKERLRARLQNASRRLAESQAAGGPPPEQKRQLPERPRGGVGSKSPPATDAAQPHSAAAAAGGTASGGGSRRSSAKEKQSARRVVRDSQGNSTPPIRVLLVEDNLVNRSVMERFLTHMNVHYDVASNGEEAIRKWTAAADESRTPGGERTAAHGPYHIVFMDIQMPLMDGITATKHIRRLERQKHIGLWVPTGSVASMHAGHLSPKPQPQPQQGTRVPMPSAPPRSVRWVPFHLRGQPPESRNGRFLQKIGVVGAPPPEPDQPLLEISSPTGSRRPSLPPPASDNTACAGDEDADAALVSPVDLDGGSLSQVAMFPPGATPPERRADDHRPAPSTPRRRPLQALQLPPRTKPLAEPPRSPLVTAPVKSPVIIVALTASSLESDRQAALAAGCNDFLTKPVGLIWLKLKIIEWGCMQALIDYDFFGKRGGARTE